MDLNNLLSGLLGAVIALILAEIWRLFLLARERRKKRQIFVAYIKNVIKPGLESYIMNTNVVKEHVESYPDPKTFFDNLPFDTLPSLNGEIFKELGFNELYFLTSDFILHEKVIDIYHGVDYLKALMPFESHQAFIDSCDAHFKEKGCKTIEDVFEHAKDCQNIKEYKLVTLGNLDMRLKSANTSLTNCELIVS